MGKPIVLNLKFCKAAVNIALSPDGRGTAVMGKLFFLPGLRCPYESSWGKKVILARTKLMNGTHSQCPHFLISLFVPSLVQSNFGAVVTFK